MEIGKNIIIKSEEWRYWLVYNGKSFCINKVVVAIAFVITFAGIGLFDIEALQVQVDLPGKLFVNLTGFLEYMILCMPERDYYWNLQSIPCIVLFDMRLWDNTTNFYDI